MSGRKWLHDVPRSGAGVFHQLAIAWLIGPGKHKYFGSAIRLRGANPLQDFDAVHLIHLQIEEHHFRQRKRRAVSIRPLPGQIIDRRPSALQVDEVEIAVQVNGKVRGHVMVAPDATEDEVRRAALEEPRVREHLAGRAIAKFVLVPGRLVSVVVR